MHEIDIAKTLGVSRRTIRLDVALIKQRNKEQREKRRIDAEEEILQEFDEIYHNLKSLRRNIRQDMPQTGIRDNAETRLQMYGIALTIEDTLLDALEKRNILESRAALKQLKSKANNIKDKYQKVTTESVKEKESATVAEEEGNIVGNVGVQEESQII